MSSNLLDRCGLIELSVPCMGPLPSSTRRRQNWTLQKFKELQYVGQNGQIIIKSSSNVSFCSWQVAALVRMYCTVFTTLCWIRNGVFRDLEIKAPTTIWKDKICTAALAHPNRATGGHTSRRWRDGDSQSSSQEKRISFKEVKSHKSWVQIATISRCRCKHTKSYLYVSITAPKLRPMEALLRSCWNGMEQGNQRSWTPHKNTISLLALAFL